MGEVNIESRRRKQALRKWARKNYRPDCELHNCGDEEDHFLRGNSCSYGDEEINSAAALRAAPLGCCLHSRRASEEWSYAATCSSGRNLPFSPWGTPVRSQDPFSTQGCCPAPGALADPRSTFSS